METKKYYMFESTFILYIVVGVVLAIFIPLAALAVFTRHIFIALFLLLSSIMARTAITQVFAKDIADAKIKKQLLKTGTKYEGKVIGYRKTSLLSHIIGPAADGINVADSNVYILTIEYDVDKTFETPSFMYDPSKFFASPKCTVYASQANAFATDFDQATGELHCEIKEIEG